MFYVYYADFATPPDIRYDITRFFDIFACVQRRPFYVLLRLLPLAPYMADKSLISPFFAATLLMAFDYCLHLIRRYQSSWRLRYRYCHDAFTDYYATAAAALLLLPLRLRLRYAKALMPYALRRR